MSGLQWLVQTGEPHLKAVRGFVYLFKFPRLRNKSILACLQCRLSVTDKDFQTQFQGQSSRLNLGQLTSDFCNPLCSAIKSYKRVPIEIIKMLLLTFSFLLMAMCYLWCKPFPFFIVCSTNFLALSSKPITILPHLTFPAKSQIEVNSHLASQHSPLCSVPLTIPQQQSFSSTAPPDT